MKVSFKDPELEILFKVGNVKTGRYKQLSRNAKLVQGYQRAVNLFYAVSQTSELKVFSYLHYEQLRNDPRSSVRILNGSVERLLFHETNDGIEVELLEIDSNHYGKKR